MRSPPVCCVRKRSCNLLRLELPDLPEPVGSNQVALRRPEVTIYRCFLPDLTGFIGFCRAGPSLQRHFSPAVSRGPEPQGGFRSRYSGLCGYRAPLAPHLARPQPSALEVGTNSRRRGRDLNPRGLSPTRFPIVRTRPYYATSPLLPIITSKGSRFKSFQMLRRKLGGELWSLSEAQKPPGGCGLELPATPFVSSTDLQKVRKRKRVDV